MFKFFRIIRQELLAGNRFRKYLLYAVGEIILVVIGILIALQINNWNEHRKERAFERQMLQSFKQSLETDLADIDLNIKLHQQGLQACDSIFSLMESSLQINEDSLARLFAEAFFVTRFIYSNSAFESLKSKGVNIISNKALQKQIVDVYDSRYRFFADSEHDYIEYYWLGLQKIYPNRFEAGLNYDVDLPGFPGDLRPLNFKTLKNDQDFIYYMKTYRNWTNIFIHFHYRGLRADVLGLMESINNELEKQTLQN